SRLLIYSSGTLPALRSFPTRALPIFNTTNYLLFTNYKDALPLDDTDRRYLILFSQWQRPEDIRAFKNENSDYYTKLYETLIDSRSEEHTSELQSREKLVCRLLLEKKK